MKKKIIGATVAMVLTFASMTVPAFACGGCHGGRYRATTQYRNYYCGSGSCYLNYRHNHFYGNRANW